MSGSSPGFWSIMWIIAGMFLFAGGIAALIFGYAKSRPLSPDTLGLLWPLRVKWGGLLVFCLAIARFKTPDSVMKQHPWFLFVPGIDIALLIAFIACAGFLFSRVFGERWNWKAGLGASFMLLYAALFALIIYVDARLLEKTTWVWMPNGIIGLVAAPLVARLLYSCFSMEPRRDRQPDT